jgi:hypothetical protein
MTTKYITATLGLQDVAERISREAKRRYYAPRVMPLDTYDVSQLPHEALIIFVTATTGQVGWYICM